MILQFPFTSSQQINQRSVCVRVRTHVCEWEKEQGPKSSAPSSPSNMPNLNAQEKLTILTIPLNGFQEQGLISKENVWQSVVGNF